MIRRMCWMPVFAGLLLVTGRGVTAEAAGYAKVELPEVTVPVCYQSPFLDGAFTDECWRSAAVISKFSVFQKPGEAVAHKAWLTSDGQWLYIAVEILHPAPKHIKQTVFEADGSVHTDDAIEVFLDPGSSNAFYLHYKLNVANIKSDGVVLRDGRRDIPAKTPWRSATALTDKGWNAELAFPLNALTDYQKRSTCDWAKARINICINLLKPIFDPYGARMSEERQGLSWSPVMGGFHEPERFGLLKGISPDPTTVPASKATAPLFSPTLVNAQPGLYEIKAGQAGFDLKVTVKNTANSTGMVEVVVLDRPVAGVSGAVRQTRAMGIGEEEDVVLTVPLKTPGRRTVVVWLNDAIHGGAFDSRLLEEQAMQVTDPFAAWLDRSYYTTEKEALAVLSMRVPQSSMAGQSVVVKDQAGRTVGKIERLTADARAPIALDQFAVGQHPLAIEWLGADGTRQAVQAAELIKLPPKSGCEVKVDKVNCVVLKDGKPIFPFGLLASALTSKDEDYFRCIAEAGFNTMSWWGRKAATTSDEYQAYLKTARKYGLQVIDGCNEFQPIPPNLSGLRKALGLKVFDKQVFSIEEEREIALADFEPLLSDLRRTWELGLQHPNLIGHCNVDEPNLCNSDGRVTVAERLYKELKKIDPYRPSLMVYACHIPPGERWTKWSEVLGYDPYVYPGWGRLTYGSPNFVAQQTIELKRRADSVHQAVWIVPVAFQMDPERTPRGLTSAEQDCQTYLALIHGAKGLLYFSSLNLYAQVAWDTLSRLAKQMKVIGPAIVAPGVPQEITYQPTPLDAEKGVFPEVQTALFRHPDGRYILLAANSVTWPVTATFTITGLHQLPFWKTMMGWKMVKDLFGNKAYPVKDHAFSDEFEPYGVRAYVLEMQNAECRMQNEGKMPKTETDRKHVPRSLGEGGSKIQITVLSQGHPEKASAEKAFPLGEIMKRKNKMPNPSFAIQTTPGAPDYIRPSYYLNWPLVGSPGAVWGIETNNPCHGMQCLRMVHQYKGGTVPPDVPLNFRITTGVFYAPSTEKPTPYTFSVYARAAREGDEISVHFYGMKPSGPASKWKLARDWKRYSFTGMLSGGVIQLFNFYTWSKDAVVYIDALQMEQGDTATEFTTE